MWTYWCVLFDIIFPYTIHLWFPWRSNLLQFTAYWDIVGFNCSLPSTLNVCKFSRSTCASQCVLQTLSQRQCIVCIIIKFNIKHGHVLTSCRFHQKLVCRISSELELLEYMQVIQISEVWRLNCFTTGKLLGLNLVGTLRGCQSWARVDLEGEINDTAKLYIKSGQLQI